MSIPWLKTGVLGNSIPWTHATLERLSSPYQIIGCSNLGTQKKINESKILRNWSSSLRQRPTDRSFLDGLWWFSDVWVTSERTHHGFIFPIASVVMSINPAMTSIGCFFPARAIRDLLMVLGDLFYSYCTKLKAVNRKEWRSWILIRSSLYFRKLFTIRTVIVWISKELRQRGKKRAKMLFKRTLDHQPFEKIQRIFCVFFFNILAGCHRVNIT